MPKKSLFKIGIATAAAAVGATLAITSVFAHATPTTTDRSMVGTIVNAATGASLVFNNDPAPTALTDEQTLDAELAAEIAAQQQAAAELAAEQAALAAEQAAEQAALAAEQAAELAEQAQDAAETETELADSEQHQTEQQNTSGDH